MQQTYAQQWSTALGMNIDATPATQDGIQRLAQSMANFLQMRDANSVMDKINAELNLLQHFGETIKLGLNYGNGIVVNEKTTQLADSFLVQATSCIKGEWPQAWGSDLKTPLLLFIAYSSASKALASGKQSIDWEKTLPLLTSSFVKTHGVEPLRAQMNGLDQLLPQVLGGAALALLDDSTMGDFGKRMHAFTAERVNDPVKPQPVEVLDILLAARKAPASVAPESPVQP